MNRLLRKQWSVSVSARLLLGLVPSLLAAAMVIGLVYWGEYGRQAPHAVMAAAGILAVLTLTLTLLNVRYLVRRFDRITEIVAAEAARGASGSRTGATDEFDRIEQVVGQLGSALSQSETERVRADAQGAARLKEQSTLLAALVRDTQARLDDVRMPLHILLETRFGELNENQEELLRDARGASDEMDAALRRLGHVADADRDAMPVTREMVQVNDLVRAILPLIRASAERQGARVETVLEPGLPRVLADRSRLAEALSLFATLSAAASDSEHPVTVTTSRDGRGAAVALRPLPPNGAEGLSGALAERLVTIQGGEVARPDGSLVVRIGAGP
ncbi:MAG: sensor histidine kinase [Gemmatimonadaceae bacterium]